MSKKEKNFTAPTDEIKTLLKIRGQNQTSLSKSTGVSLFILNKFINNTPFQGKNGAKHHYKVPYIRTAIEKYLNISSDILWTDDGKETLRKIIADEMIATKRIPKSFSRKSPQKPWRFRTLLKNIVTMGKQNIFWR